MHVLKLDSLEPTYRVFKEIIIAVSEYNQSAQFVDLISVKELCVRNI